MDELRKSGDEEFQKRTEAERALREAAALFKQELFQRSEEAARLLGEMNALRDTHARELVRGTQHLKRLARGRSCRP